MHAVCQQNREIPVTKFCQHLQTRSAGNARRFWASSAVFPPTIAIERNDRCPAAIACNTAFRSAQIVMEYDAFSTLQPRNILPSVPCKAAPTENRNTVHMPVPVPPMHNPSWFSCCLVPLYSQSVERCSTNSFARLQFASI